MPLDVEAVLERVSGWGSYQKRVYLLACLPSIMSGVTTVSYSWTAYVNDHRCLVNECEWDTNATYTSEFLNFTTPPDPEHRWQRCSRYKSNGSLGGGTKDSCTAGRFDPASSQNCDSWVFDTSVMQETAVTEFDLVCERAWLQPLGYSLYFVGMMIGSVISGILADRLGRVTTLVLACLLTTLVTTVSAFSPNYTVFAALRLLTPVMCFSLFTVAFVLSTEMTSIQMRPFCGIFINVFFAVGEAIAGVFPVYVKRWRTLQLVYSVPTVVFCIYWFILPESPRWLASTNKIDKAEQVLRKIAKENGKPFPEDLLKQEAESQDVQALVEEKSGHPADLLRSPVLRKRCLIICIQWLVVSMVYYGIGMVSTDLAGNVYVNFILTMLIEIPSYIFAMVALNPLGRKLTVVGTFLVSGAGTMAAGIVQSQGVAWLITCLALVGKFGVAAAFASIYLYTAELYPTSLRTLGIGVASAFGRIGTICAPFIASAGGGNPTLPLCIFGASGLLAGAVTLTLPETSGQDLPSTVQQAERFGSDQPCLPVPCLTGRQQHRWRSYRSTSDAANSCTAHIVSNT